MSLVQDDRSEHIRYYFLYCDLLSCSYMNTTIMENMRKFDNIFLLEDLPGKFFVQR